MTHNNNNRYKIRLLNCLRKSSLRTLWVNTLFLCAFFVASPASAQLNLLFYGNSYTESRTINSGTLFLPSVPVMVQDIAVRAGQASPTAFNATESGKTLTWHGANNTAIISSGLPLGQSWDYVIMQDQSFRPLNAHPNGNLSAHRSGALNLFNAVKSHSSAVVPVLFETWAREQSSVEYYGGSGYYNNPGEMQTELRSGYGLAAVDINGSAGSSIALTASVGDAFENASFNNLYVSDDSHMNARGRLLSSLVIYSTIYGDDTHDLFLAGALDSLLSSLGLGASDGDELTIVADSTTGLLVTSIADVFINELLINAENPASAADQGQEFIEIKSVSGVAESLDGITFIYIEGDGSNAGVVDVSLNLTGFSTGSNGLFVWSDANTSWDPAADAATVINIGEFNNDDGSGTDMENGSATFALVSGYVGSAGQDLDTDNDGTLDSTPWDSVISVVGWTESSTSTEVSYAAQMGGTQFDGNTLGEDPDGYVRTIEGEYVFGLFDDDIDLQANGEYRITSANALRGDGTIVIALSPVFSLTPGSENSTVDNDGLDIPAMGFGGLLMLLAMLAGVRFYRR